MNAIILVFAAALAVAHGGVIAHTGLISQTIVEPAIHSTHIQGPGTHTDVAGPDGSHIVADNPGGRVDTSEHVALAHDLVSPAVIAHGAPLIAAYSAHAAPLIAHGYLAGEGQYLHDFTENLYDDGSYKGEIY